MGENGLGVRNMVCVKKRREASSCSVVRRGGLAANTLTCLASMLVIANCW